MLADDGDGDDGDDGDGGYDGDDYDGADVYRNTFLGLVGISLLATA